MSPATSPVHLSSSAQRNLDARINEAQRKVNVLEANIREEVEKLGNAREVYTAACKRLASGKDADPTAARDKVRHYEDKILGMQSLLREPKQLLDELRRELSAEVARADEAKQSVQILDEQDVIQKQIERAMRAIEERQRLDESIVAIVGNLRSRTYLTAKNKQAAFEGAYRVDRKAAGILN